MYGGEDRKENGLVPELHDFTFMLCIHASLESPDTEKRETSRSGKRKKKKITHMQNPTNYSNPWFSLKGGEKEQAVNF